MENQYSAYYKNHSEKELIEVINQPEIYEDEARLAAFYKLKQKNVKLNGGQLKDFDKLKDELIRQERIQGAEKVLQTDVDKIQEWYSPAAVLGFSIFLSPLFGAILLSYNLKKANKKPQANYVIIIGVLFLALGATLAYTGRMTQIASIGISVVAGLIFIELFWKKHLGYQTKYKRKSIWKALIIVLGIVALLAGIQFYLNPELFKELVKIAQTK